MSVEKERDSLESLKFGVEGGAVCISDGEVSAAVPAALWKRLMLLSPAELLAARAEVAELAGDVDAESACEIEHDDEEEDASEYAEPGRERAILKPGPLVIDGRSVEVPGLTIVTFRDDPLNVPKATDGRMRRSYETITGIVVHTTGGRRGTMKPGSKASRRALNLARYQSNTKRQVSWHLTIDTDALVVQSADPRWLCWHAGHVNAHTVGIELVQDKDGSVYADQIAAAARVIGVLCGELGVSRQTPVRNGEPFAKLLVPDDLFPGVYGHRNVWKLSGGKKVGTRGPGDPGNAIFAALLADGFRGVEV